MHHSRIAVVITIAAVAIIAAACGTDSTPQASPTPRTATATAQSATPPAATPAPSTPGNTTPGGTTPAPPAPTLSPDERLERAPIDVAEIIVRESSPPQYAVRVLSGLPSGCHQFEGVTMSRNGTLITIDVENRVKGGADTACTAIYGTHEQIVELGSDFTSGTVYTVRVNDRTLELHAQ